MLPERVAIGHFRALRNCEIALTDNTTLVGPNGAGKSTFLRASRFFFGSILVDEDDWQPGATDDLSVTLTFSELNEQEADWYRVFLDAYGKLVVTRSASIEGDARYSVMGRSHLGFRQLRESADGKSAFVAAFKAFAEEHSAYQLVKARSAGACEAELRRWESEHEDQLETAEMPFSFIGTSKDRAIPSTRVVYVPAVHDASDDFEGSRSPLAQMIDALVMPQVEKNPELAALRERLREEYETLFRVAGTQELQHLADRLSATIGTFAPGASVSLTWDDFVPKVAVPNVVSRIVDDGVTLPIGSQGHGLQRALIIALLQARNEQLQLSTDDGSTEPMTHIVLLIEEPELYQHPPRARYLRRVLKKLTSTPSSNSRFRVIATTHSPNFISLDDLESIRIVRKSTARTEWPARTVSSVTGAKIIEEYSRLTGGQQLSESSLQKNLHALDVALREAFFAQAIVLTEGPSDIGFLLAQAEFSGIDLEALGIVMASVGGKGQLPIAVTILRMLGISYYVIFDGDSEGNLAENQRLLRCLGASEIPSVGTAPATVKKSYAVLNPKIEAVASDEFGAVAYATARQQAARFLGRNNDVDKNPVGAKVIAETLLHAGASSRTLAQIVDKIAALS